MMRRSDWLRVGVIVGAMQGLAASAQAEDPAAGFRWKAPIEVQQASPFMYLYSSVELYAHTLQPELRDLRIVDARGEPVPFTVETPTGDEARPVDVQRDAVLYPLPPRPTRDAEWASPIEVTVAGDQIAVKRLGGAPENLADAPGWLIDLGEGQGESRPHTLRLLWSEPAEFTASFEFETSDDLRSWRAHGRGSVMALASASKSLSQPSLPLPYDTGRFLRLVWSEGTRPLLTGATVVATGPDLQEPTIAPEGLVFAPVDPATTSASSPGALVFDLGGSLPVELLDLRLVGTVVAPVRLEGRAHSDEAWRGLGEHVVYRIERDTEVRSSPPIAVSGSLREVRVTPDPRTPGLSAADTKLVVYTRMASVVFAMRGEPPFTLYAGSTTAAAGALPAVAFIPEGEHERTIFGGAAIGAWSEVPAADRQWAVLRPWLLWSVLLAGVGGLGLMVWRLTRR